MGDKTSPFGGELDLICVHRRIKTHISSKTETLFSSVPMEQRLMCKYLTAEK